MMKSWKLLLGLLGFWLAVMLYMSSSLMPGASEINHKVESQLRRALDELEALKSQHKELQHLAGELKWVPVLTLPSLHHVTGLCF